LASDDFDGLLNLMLIIFLVVMLMK